MLTFRLIANAPPPPAITAVASTEKACTQLGWARPNPTCTRSLRRIPAAAGIRRLGTRPFTTASVVRNWRMTTRAWSVGFSEEEAGVEADRGWGEAGDADLADDVEVAVEGGLEFLAAVGVLGWALAGGYA